VVELVPNYGPNSGGNRVIVKGNNFMPFNFTDDIDNSNDTFCIFEGIGKVRAYALNSTKVYCEAPPNYVTERTNVEVTLNNQQYTDDNIPYFYYKPPQVFDADPREGPTRGGTEVVVFGAKFQQGKNITCKFGAKTTRGTYIDSNRISCVSPPVERAGYVPLSIAYEGEKYDSDTIKYLYYDTPELKSFYPTCGPVTGYTQITIEGKNFLDMGFGKAKCIFNNTYVMNATIMDSETIKCDSPALPEGMFISNGTQAPWYNISITLNGRENAPVKGSFSYYIDPIFKSITPNLGPLLGGTVSKIEGTGFAQDGVCNVTVRYGALTQKP
jgi:IPT/TIG domain